MKKIHDYKTSVPFKPVTNIKKGLLVTIIYVMWLFQCLTQWWSGKLYKIWLRMEDDYNYLFPFRVGFKSGWNFAFTPIMQLKEVILRHSKIFSFSEHALRE